MEKIAAGGRAVGGAGGKQINVQLHNWIARNTDYNECEYHNNFCKE